MATKPRRTRAHQLMVNCLNQTYLQHGEPYLSRVLKTLKRLPDLYPDFAGAGDAAGLSSKGNIQKILAGTHDSLPSASQLSRLILAFQHLARVDEVIPVDPGVSTLRGWQALLIEARTLDKEQVRRGEFIEDAGGVDAPVRLPTPSPLAEPSRPLAVPEPVEMTRLEMHALTTLGQYARSLAVRTSTGDPGVLFEVALALIASSSPYAQRAESFAANAGAAGVSAATDLFMAFKTGRDEARVFAVTQARVLEYAALRSGDEAAARFFGRCAGRATNPGTRGKAPLLEG